MLKRASKIISVKSESDTVKTFTLKKPLGFKYFAGQFCLLSTDRIEAGKPFSMTSNPESPHLSFTIRLVGNMTSKFFKMNPGDELIVEGPFGRQMIKDSCAKYAFIAGGTGITPVISVLRQFRAAGIKTPVKLFYSNKLEEDFALAADLEGMQGVERTYFLTGEKVDDWKGEFGRITREKILANTPKPAEWCWRVIGPPIMVAEITRTLEKIGVPIEQIRF